MTQTSHRTIDEPSSPAVPGSPTDPPPPGRRRRVLAVAAVGAVSAIAAVLALLSFTGDGDGDRERADVSAQGSAAEVLSEDAATLERNIDGVFVDVDVPTPAPGSYEYPAPDMVPPGADPHPRVASGSSDAPEVFTLWVFAFNFPEQCTDADCGDDDLGPEAAAMGGAFQADGRVADGDRLRLNGGVRLGQRAANGVVFENPLGAEIHLAIAPHGRWLAGTDGWRQLNGPVGTPGYWWSASFLP